MIVSRSFKVLFDLFSNFADLDVKLAFGSRVGVARQDAAHFFDNSDDFLAEACDHTAKAALFLLFVLVFSGFTHADSLGDGGDI